MPIPAPESGAGNVCYSCLDNIQSTLSRSRVGHLWDLIVHWFCQTVEGEAKLQLYKLSNSESEWDKMDAFFKLRGMTGEGHRSNFVIGKNEQDGTLRLSVQVEGSEVWSLDSSCTAWFSQTVTSEVISQFCKLFGSQSERDKIDAFLNLREMAAEEHGDNFVIGKNEQDGTGRLSIQVEGCEVWSLDFSCVVGLHQEVKRFGETFVEAVRQNQGPEKHASCEHQTDLDLTRATVTIEEQAFRYRRPKDADSQQAEADHIGTVKSALGACLADQRLYEAVVRLLNQGSFAPLTKLHVEGQPRGAHGSVAGSPLGNLVGSYRVKSTENGAEIVFSQANDSITHLYINFEPVPTESTVSYARSKFTVHLNHQGEITHCSSAKIDSEYRLVEPQHYLDALTLSAS